MCHTCATVPAADGPTLTVSGNRSTTCLSGVADKLHRDFHNRQRLTLSLQKRLQALSPQDTLRRGFAIVQARPGGEVVTDPGRLVRGDRVEVTLARGGFSADVASTRPNPSKAASDADRTPSGGTP